MEVNRIIELDADTSREGTDESFLYIRYVDSVTRTRSQQPDASPDIEKDLFILVHAVVCLVVEAEKEDTIAGKVMSKVMSNLQNLYVDSSIDTSRLKFDTEGKVEYKHIDREHGF